MNGFSPLSGALAGFTATVPMTIAMQVMHQRLPWPERYPLPPSEITAQITEAAGLRQRMGQREHVAATMATHFAIGAAAGALYGPLAVRYYPNPLVGGVAFGLAVWGASYLGILPTLGILTPATEHPPRRTALMIGAHVVWGAALGLLVDQMTQREA